MDDVLVLGAGITGLSLAYYLKKSGCRVRLVEAAEASGGVLKTCESDGFLLEFGAQSVYARPAFLELVRDLGISDSLVEPSVGLHRYLAVTRDGQRKLLPLPRSLPEVLTSSATSHWSKFRLLCEIFFPKFEREDDSVRALLERRLGREFTDTFVASALAGIYAGDIGQLSCRSTLPHVWSYEQDYGSLIRGILKHYRNKRVERPRALSFNKGISVLIQALVQAIGTEDILTGVRAESVRQAGPHLAVYTSGVDKRVIPCKKLILTTPAPVSAQLLRSLAPTLSLQIQSVPYAPLGILHLACERQVLEKSFFWFRISLYSSAWASFDRNDG